jgi:hypothetical protein
MVKIQVLLNNNKNKDCKFMPCGYKLSGRLEKMKICSNLHKKTCELCSNFTTKTLTDMTDKYLPNKKVDYLKYIKGEYSPFLYKKR